jgi:hypothetical protein
MATGDSSIPTQSIAQLGLKPKAIYEPLPNSGDFRLLTLLPTRPNEKIRCTLFIASLACKPTYEALSYVWGSPTTSHDILCNGAELQITQNLHTALRQLCYPDLSRTIWADGICINQEDIAERNTQLQLMGGIYSSAASVIVSLGETSQDIHLAVALAHSLGEAYAAKCEVHATNQWRYKKYHDTDLSLGVCHDTNQIGKEPAETMIDVVHTPGWPALCDLFQRPWFTRAWVLQEVVLSKECYLICGTKAISWDVLTSACSYLRESVVASVVQEDIRRADYMTALSSSLRNFSDQERRSPLVEALTAARSLQATNPRDKIYSLLGIINSKNKSGVATHKTSVFPDYAETINKVFIEVARLAISQTQTLEILSHVGRSPEQTADGLPSWVPDWRHEIPCIVLGRINHNNEFHFDASGADPRRKSQRDFQSPFSAPWLNFFDEIAHVDYPSIPFSPPLSVPADPSHLHLRGLSFDTITATSDLFICDLYEQHNVTDTNNLIYKDFWATLDCFLQSHKVHRIYGSDTYSHRGLRNSAFELTQDAYLRTVCANLDISNSFYPGGQGWYYKLSFISSSYSVTRGGDVRRKNVTTILSPASWALMQRMRIKRYLIATKRGYLGIAPSWVRAGDKICVMSGGSVPLVLRERAGTEGAHELIGECYVHGIMNGGAVDICRRKGVEYTDFLLV